MALLNAEVDVRAPRSSRARRLCGEPGCSRDPSYMSTDSRLVAILKFEIDFEDFTLSLIGANMENHSFFYRNALWECVPAGGCPGMTVGGRTPGGG